MARRLFGTDDEATFTYFRLAVRLVVHAMQLEILREPTAPFARANAAPTHPDRGRSTAQIAFREAMFASDAWRAYRPLRDAGASTFEETAALTEAEPHHLTRHGRPRLHEMR